MQKVFVCDTPGRKTNQDGLGHASPGERATSTDDQVCDRADGFLDVKYASLWRKRARARARALSGAHVPPLSRLRRFTASRWQDPTVDVARLGSESTRIGPRASRIYVWFVLTYGVMPGVLGLDRV